MKKLDLLLIAPGCDGSDVGESWVGHQWVRRLSARHRVTLLTYYKRDREPPSRQLVDTRVVEWPDLPLVGRAERMNSLLKPGYITFSLHCTRWIRDALARGEHFDLAHQLVPVAMRYPSPFANFSTPYLLGPVGGGLADPPGFDDDGDTAPWYVGLRALDRWRLRFDPTMRKTYENAACVLGIAPYVEDALAGLSIQRFEVMSETAIAGLPEPVDRTGRTGPVRLLYVGRVVRTKGLRDAIRALALLRTSHHVVFDVVGDGFDRDACEALARELGVADRVQFHGQQPRSCVDDFYRAADVFVFPSYREPGGNVAYEAMSFALPLVVSDRGGPGSAVDDSSGFRVHASAPEQFAADLAVAIARLVDDPELRRAMGDAGRGRVAGLALWDPKVELLEHLYAEILDVRSPQPTPG